MYGIERQEQILAILREKKSCSVTELAETLMALAIVIVAVCLGNYVQKNKEEVKEKLKEFIDKF